MYKSIFPPSDLPEPRQIALHGHSISYREAGEGPVICLIHGITGSSQTWRDAFGALAMSHRVIAPDLIGHGESAKPIGDYSLGAFAAGIRDVLAALDADRATIVGHSLGGGVAMQFAYQFPERTERMVLVSSGGLGKDVSWFLRLATLPGSGLVLPFLSGRYVQAAGDLLFEVGSRLGFRGGPSMEEIWDGFTSLADAEARRAFLHTLRGMLDLTGQRVSARDRLYLAEHMPTLLIWGERDPIIPVAHGREAVAEIPGGELEVIPDAGHFPHREDPRRFVDTLLEFIDRTEPSAYDEDRVRASLRRG